MFTNIVFSGGAIKGLTYIGCIKYLNEKHLVKHIKNVVGASVGSIFALLLCLNTSASDMIQLTLDIIGSLKNVDIENIFNIYDNLGIVNPDEIIKHLKKFIKTKFGYEDLTFLELSKLTGKNLVIAASNMNNHTTKFFCVDQDHNMSICEAIKGSICIPFLFEPLIYNGNIYVDASMFNNTPFDYCKRNAFIDTLIIELASSKIEPVLDKDLKLAKYINIIICSTLNKANEKKPLENSRTLSILLDYSYEEIFLKIFQINKNDIRMYIEKGYNAMIKLMSCNDSFVEFH